VLGGEGPWASSFALGGGREGRKKQRKLAPMADEKKRGRVESKRRGKEEEIAPKERNEGLGSGKEGFQSRFQAERGDSNIRERRSRK